MSAIAKIEQSSLPGMPDEVHSMMDVILRAAKDPLVDVAKVQALMAMAKEMRNEQAEQAYSAAMLEAQKEMDPVRADCKNDETKSKYASYGALNNAIRPIYTKHGFSISYDTEDNPTPDYVRNVAFVRHISGHTQRYKLDIPADGKGAKGGAVMTRTHAVMSAVTYGKRGLLGGIFDIVITTDDDGNSAGGSEPITAEELDEINGMLGQCNGDPEKFCKFMKVTALGAIKQKDMRKAREALNAAISDYQRANPRAKGKN